MVGMALLATRALFIEERRFGGRRLLAVETFMAMRWLGAPGPAPELIVDMSG